jgi:hypothetical protein
MLLIGLAAAISSGESMSWFTPLPGRVRTWARVTVLALTGLPLTATILAALAAADARVPVPWAQLAANLWCCWVGGGLLLLFLGDLIQSEIPFVQILSILFGVAPGVGLAAYHIAQKCPWETVPAEAAAVAVLVGLTLITKANEEVREHEYFPRSWRQPGGRIEEVAAVPAISSRRKLDRTPSMATLLRAGLSGSRPTSIMVAFWFLCSLLPISVAYAMLGLIVLPIAFQSALNYWRPFQTVPLSRPKVFVLLTAPILALWILMVAVQCLSSWAFESTRLLRVHSDGLQWDLPAAKRSRNAELPPEFRKRELPRDPERLAVLMSDAYRAAYGLDIPVAQILAIPAPEGAVDNGPWLRAVDHHFERAVSRRLVEWRLLLGTAMLALGLFSIIDYLPGRWTTKIRWVVVSLGLMVPMIIFVILSVESNGIANHLPDLLRPAYQAIYDRPGTLTAALAAVSVALYLRHLRVFRTSEILEPHVRI